MCVGVCRHLYAHVCISLSHRRKSQKNAVGLMDTEEQLFGSEIVVCPAIIRHKRDLFLR